jgi:hypothetical protein
MRNNKFINSATIIIYCICFSTILISEISAQNISGIVTSFKDIPVRNVIITSSGSGETVRSDSSGRYFIKSAPGDILIFSASGFAEKKIKVRKDTVINAGLKYLYGESSFNDAVVNNHFTATRLKSILKKYPPKGQKDYNRYSDIFALIRGEISNVRVSGNSVYSIMATSFSLSSQVLYVVDNTIVSDITYIAPIMVQKIEYLDGINASDYGMRGTNGVIKITLKK